MIWSKEKTVRLSVNGEEMNVTFRIPTALDMEDVLDDIRKESKNTDSKVFTKFVTAIDGFKSAEDFVNTPMTSKIVNVVSVQIINAATLDVELKN